MAAIQIFSQEVHEAAERAERYYNIWQKKHYPFLVEADAVDSYIFEKTPLSPEVRESLKTYGLARDDGRPSFFLEAIFRSQFSRYERGGEMDLASNRAFDRVSFMEQFQSLLDAHQSLGLDGVDDVFHPAGP